MVDCPICKRKGQVFRHRNSYLTFICKCGVVVTAVDKFELKRKLEKLARKEEGKR